MSSCHIEDGANNVKEEGTSNAHISTHIGENLYSCNTCSKNFNKNSQLLRHLKTHIGLKNHSCNQCVKIFQLQE